jgi:hypothetical protein
MNATMPKTMNGCRRWVQRWCEDNGVTLDPCSSGVYLVAPLGSVMVSNGERRQLTHDWRDAFDMVSYGITNLEADWDLSAWPNRATDPVTAGIVADYLEERGADEVLVEQYRDAAYEGEA